MRFTAVLETTNIEASQSQNTSATNSTHVRRKFSLTRSKYKERALLTSQSEIRYFIILCHSF